jgi:hypothetical protein
MEDLRDQKEDSRSTRKIAPFIYDMLRPGGVWCGDKSLCQFKENSTALLKRPAKVLGSI